MTTIVAQGLNGHSNHANACGSFACKVQVMTTIPACHFIDSTFSSGLVVRVGKRWVVQVLLVLLSCCW